MNIRRAAKTVINFLRPTPLDAWVLATVLYWLIAVFASILWYLESSEFDPIDLPTPLLVGALAMVLGLSVVAFYRGLSRLTVLLFFATILAGGMLYLLAGQWLGITKPQRLNPYDSYVSPSTYEYLRALMWHSVALPVALLASFLIAQTSRRFSSLVTWGPKFLSFLNRHRARLMIAFVVIMLPATMIRNALDPELQSTPYIMVPIFGGLIALSGLIIVLLLQRFVLNRNWFTLKFLFGLGFSVVAGAIASAESWDSTYYRDTLGFACAAASAPAFFVLSLLASAFYDNAEQHQRKGKRFSLWSFLLVIPTIGGIGYLLYRYDPLVPALEYQNDPRGFLQAKWLTTAEDSRQFQHATHGAARELSWYGQPIVYVKIRDQRDADCLRLLLQYRPSLAVPLVIENLQPFVDARPLKHFAGVLNVMGGQVTAAQMADICDSVSSFGVSNVTLPDVSSGAKLLAPFYTFGDQPIPGLSDFLDAYMAPSMHEVTIQTPLNMDDWNAIVRNSHHRSFSIINHEFLPSGALESPELAKQKSLKSISLYSANMPLDARTLLLLLDTDLVVGDLTLPDDQFFWDFVFSKPEAKLWPERSEEIVSFTQQAADFHWVYGREGDAITHLWLPSVEYVAEHSSHMKAVQTLRLDLTGFVGLQKRQYSELGELAKLPNLRRLYLDRGHHLMDLRFLRSLTKLQHLQIQSQARTTMPFNGFEVCKNLETLRVFGTPDPKTIKELAGLKKLQRVEIVDDDATFDKESEVDKLKSKLPGVEVHVIASEEFQADLSEGLQQHLENVRRRLREKLKQELKAEQSP